MSEHCITENQTYQKKNNKVSHIFTEFMQFNIKPSFNKDNNQINKYSNFLMPTAN